MPSFRKLDDLEVSKKRVLLRVDFNVPMKEGKVLDATRIERAAQTISELVGKGARVIILSHFGRPKGKPNAEMSLAPIVEPLERALGGRRVHFVGDCVGTKAAEAVARLGDGEVALLENLRFHEGEEKNAPDFVAELAALGEVYVNDAFSAAHRAHASVEGLAHALPAAAGRLMQEELEHLGRALGNPARPLAALVGGAKVSSKLGLLENLSAKVDLLIIGGGMANTFLHALGVGVGRSLCEKEMADTARRIVAAAKKAGCDIVLPNDAQVADKLAPGVASRVVPIKAVPEDAMILDVGPATAEHLARRLGDCRTLVWNGPLGCFEVPPFDAGTSYVAKAAADLTRKGRLLSVAGGGDTVAALAQAGVVENFSYVSTAGGAFLEWLEGKSLPGVAALEA